MENLYIINFILNLKKKNTKKTPKKAFNAYLHQ